MIHCPKLLIIDTSMYVTYLRAMVGNLPEFYAEENKILALIFENIRKEDVAIEELGYECLSIMESSLETVYENDIETIMSTIIKIGEAIYLELKCLGAYLNGVLPYKFRELIGNDIVLERI